MRSVSELIPLRIVLNLIRVNSGQSVVSNRMETAMPRTPQSPLAEPAEAICRVEMLRRLARRQVCSRLPFPSITQLPARLHLPQLPFSFEPSLLVAAWCLSEREPNLVGPFCDRRLRRNCSLWLGGIGQGTFGHRNGYWFHGSPLAGSGRPGLICVCKHTFVLSGPVVLFVLSRSCSSGFAHTRQPKLWQSGDALAPC